MRLILVRHGETVGGSSWRYWGRTDVALSAEGLAQVEKLKQRLVREPVRAVYASTLQRASVTAETIVAGNGLSVTHCPELNEVDFGQFEGLSLDEMRTQHPEFFQRWVDWDTGLAFPGGESVKHFSLRVSRFLKRLAVHDAQDAVLVVAHAGSLRMLICRLLGLKLSHWRQLKLDLASISIVEALPQGALLTRLNDTSHLA